MRRLWAVTGSIVFFVLAPGTVAVLAPWLIARQWPVESLWPDTGWTKLLAVVLAAAGLAALAESFARFAIEGSGTPAPVAPTKRLVVSGLYRYLRNPMYVAVLAVIIGWAVWFGSPPLFGYAALVWLCFTIFVLVYEEPTLRRTFGEEYAIYSANVGPWIPRLRPWTAPV